MINHTIKRFFSRLVAIVFSIILIMTMILTFIYPTLFTESTWKIAWYVTASINIAYLFYRIMEE